MHPGSLCWPQTCPGETFPKKAELVVILRGGMPLRRVGWLNPRICRVAALPAPNDCERMLWYLQRYVSNSPAGGKIVLVDRSWYNRAGAERVVEFCTDKELRNILRDGARV